MPDLSQTAEDATLAQAFRQGDEQALTTFFRQEYDALLDRAATELGGDLAHYRGRVIHTAMLDVWSNRGLYATLDGVRAALHEAIREQAGIQRRKHAALHHGASHAGGSARSHVTVPTADEASIQLLQALHAGPVDHAQALQEAVSLRKQHAAEHVQKVSKGRGWVVPTVLIVVVGVGIAALMSWVNRSGTEIAATRALEAENARVVNAGRGQRGNVSLLDGTTVRIGSETELRAPADFGALVRTVQLTGAASFDVAPDRPLPFVVRAGAAVITVSGTRLTVRAYGDDPDVFVAVDDGSANVQAKEGGDATTLTAGQALRLSANGNVVMLDSAQRAAALSWLADSLVFAAQPLREVLPEMVRWLGVTATLGDSSLGARPVTLRVALQSSGDAVKALTSAAGLAVGFDADGKIVLADSAGAVPPKR